MNYAKQLAYKLSLIGIATLMGSALEASDEYVAPEQAVPRGRAPGMQVKLLSQGEETKEYAVIFGKGDEAFSGLLDFAEKYHVTSAHFTAIGALSGCGSEHKCLHKTSSRYIKSRRHITWSEGTGARYCLPF